MNSGNEHQWRYDNEQKLCNDYITHMNSIGADDGSRSDLK